MLVTMQKIIAATPVIMTGMVMLQWLKTAYVQGVRDVPKRLLHLYMLTMCINGG